MSCDFGHIEKLLTLGLMVHLSALSKVHKLESVCAFRISLDPINHLNPLGQQP